MDETADRPQSSPATPSAEQWKCSSCGAEALWLVAMRYRDDSIAGRLLLYCGDCRRRHESRVGAAVPVQALNHDADSTLMLLYVSGATDSDPESAIDVVGLPPGPWTEVAHRCLAQAAAGTDPAARRP